MGDLDERATKRAITELVGHSQWTADDKRRLSAVITLAMLASGRADDVTPAAMKATYAFLADSGVDLSADPQAIGAALDKALVANAPTRALTRAAEQIIVNDVARRQSARLRRASNRFLNPPSPPKRHGESSR